MRSIQFFNKRDSNKDKRGTNAELKKKKKKKRITK